MIFLRISFLIAFVLPGLFVHSQSSRADTIKMLCQTWKIKQLDQEPIDESLREDWKEMIRFARTEFKKDMTVIESDDETAEKSKWALSQSAKEIKFTNKDGETKVWVIVSLSPSAFRFKENDFWEGMALSGTLIPVKK